MKVKMFRTLHTLHEDQSGQDLIEYALIAALITFGAVTAMNALSSGIDRAFSAIYAELEGALT